MGTSNKLYLKEWIDKRGISRAEMSRRVGVRTATIKSWTEGSVAPRADALLKLADALDVTVAELFARP
jgi:transcriptional regulator with XRE-family HTH domain